MAFQRQIEYAGLIFGSDVEIKAYKELSIFKDLKTHPEPILIEEGYTSLTGKKYPRLMYEPDFTLEVDGKKFILEIKSHNDLLMILNKGQKPSFKDNGDMVRLKHKIIDRVITLQNKYFVVVRVSNLKTPQYAGCFWEKDHEQMLKFKTMKRPDLACGVPRINERLNMWIQKWEL